MNVPEKFSRKSDGGVVFQACKDSDDYAAKSEALAAAPTPPAQSIGDDDLRMRWRLAGGKFHGPNVETGYMPEEKLLPFLRSFVAPTPPAPEVEPVAWVEVKDSYEGPYEFHGIKLLASGKHNLYTHPANDGLREAAEEFLKEWRKCMTWTIPDALIESIQNLRAELEKNDEH